MENNKPNKIGKCIRDVQEMPIGAGQSTSLNDVNSAKLGSLYMLSNLHKDFNRTKL